MKHGHVTGRKRTRYQDTSWYASIAEATLTEMDATWPPSLPLAEPVAAQEASSIEMDVDVSTQR